MKLLSLLVSIVVFFAAGYFLITDFQFSADLNNVLYMSILIVLMLICLVTILFNYPVLMQHRKKIKTIIYNSYSEKRTPNKEFDSQYGTL
jgi:membrane protein DedA with SNARE-associated domain